MTTAPNTTRITIPGFDFEAEIEPKVGIVCITLTFTLDGCVRIVPVELWFDEVYQIGEQLIEVAEKSMNQIREQIRERDSSR